MAGRRTEILDIQEVVRWIRTGRSDRAIAEDLGADRKTVATYRKFARVRGWLEGPMPEAAWIEQALALGKPTTTTGPASTVEPYRERIEALAAKKIKGVAIHRLLVEAGFQGSYSAVRRFMGSLRKGDPEVFVRIEVPAGSEGQVDFGYVGLIFDEVRQAMRRAWAFVMVLSFSRHLYVELVWDQALPTWLRLHANAFAHFGGVPGSVVLDNLKAGIEKACFCEPVVQRTYRDFASHYGFMVRPCRPRTPQHKGKVERGVQYVAENALAGRTFRNLGEANEHLRRWIVETAGQRIHGTTKKRPLELFEQLERPALQPVPSDALPLLEWTSARVSRDGYVTYDQAFYSVPSRLAGRTVWVRNSGRTLDVFDRYTLEATHSLAHERGQRQTVPAHLPATKTGWAEETAEWCFGIATELGPSVRAVVDRWLASRPSDKMPAVRMLVGFRKKYSPARIDAACARAIAFDEVSCLTIRRILANGHDRDVTVPTELLGIVTATPRFARDASEFFASETGGEEPCLSLRS